MSDLTPNAAPNCAGWLSARPVIRYGGTGPAAVYVPATDLAALLDACDERDRLRIWQERVALAAGIADEVEGRGVHLESDPDIAAEHMAGLLSLVDTHAECPVYCGGCGETLADAWCDHCHGSGCGPGTATGAYEECEWCAGAGKVHLGCADRCYAELVAERDRLAAERDAFTRQCAEEFAWEKRQHEARMAEARESHERFLRDAHRVSDAYNTVARRVYRAAMKRRKTVRIADLLDGQPMVWSDGDE